MSSVLERVPRGWWTILVLPRPQSCRNVEDMIVQDLTNQEDRVKRMDSEEEVSVTPAPNGIWPGASDEPTHSLAIQPFDFREDCPVARSGREISAGPEGGPTSMNLEMRSVVS